MSAFSSNFTKVTRGRGDEGQPALFIEGKTDDTDDALTRMYVNLADEQPERLTGNGTITLPAPSVPVPNAEGAVDWTATLTGDGLPDVNDWVVVVGLAERGADPAFLWAQTLQVKGEGVRAA